MSATTTQTDFIAWTSAGTGLPAEPSSTPNTPSSTLRWKVSCHMAEKLLPLMDCSAGRSLQTDMTISYTPLLEKGAGPET